MTASISTKGALAGVAAIVIAGAAFAQGNPPAAGTKDPATGAGQQSTQVTPMGTTGTPSTGGATAAGSTSGSTAAGSTSGSSGSTMGAAGSTTADTSTSAAGGRAARADRN